MPIFAEVPDWVVWLVGTGGTAIVWAATWLVSRRKEKRQEAKEDEKGIVDHQAELIKRQGEEIIKLRQRADETEHLVNRLLQHVGYLEGIMTAKGEKFKSFAMDDTGTHAIAK